ncbi:MAG: GNAT family N-acetyltransferase [Oscillospiraceae bacterium]|nr:GNAT family N-acetyltransferase [Oscillospiraceae bacterium]
MDFNITDTLTPQEYSFFRKAVEWLPATAPQAQALQNSSKFAVARTHTGQPAGMVRWFGDGGMLYVIADMIVLPEYQGTGLGSCLLQTALAAIRAEVPTGQRRTVYLMAAEGKEPYYEKNGFVIRPNTAQGLGAGCTLVIEP